MKTLLRQSICLFAVLTVVTGVLYPLAVTGIAQTLFRSQANGSIIVSGGAAVGSSLIGQEFSSGPDAPGYFWGRPSATAPVPYAAFNGDKGTGSSGSNLGVLNPALVSNCKARLDALKAADDAAGYVRTGGEKPPVDLVTSSASGLDPHISIAGAMYQAGRVAKARGMSESAMLVLVKAHTHARQAGVLGEPVVNVLELNLALDRTMPKSRVR